MRNTQIETAEISDADLDSVSGGVLNLGTDVAAGLDGVSGNVSGGVAGVGGVTGSVNGGLTGVSGFVTGSLA